MNRTTKMRGNARRMGTFTEGLTEGSLDGEGTDVGVEGENKPGYSNMSKSPKAKPKLTPRNTFSECTRSSIMAGMNIMDAQKDCMGEGK